MQPDGNRAHKCPVGACEPGNIGRFGDPVRRDRAAYISWSSRADRWFSLNIDGGYSVNHFEEDTPEAEVEALLKGYVEAAVAYVTASSVPGGTRRGQRLVPISVGMSTARWSFGDRYLEASKASCADRRR